MQSTTAFILLLIASCSCQRPFYAGRLPIGIPAVANSLTVDERFGENLPPQLKGDVAYANRLNQLPADQQPIWFLNPRQNEENFRNPQTYPQRPSIFNENSS